MVDALTVSLGAPSVLQVVNFPLQLVENRLLLGLHGQHIDSSSRGSP